MSASELEHRVKQAIGYATALVNGVRLLDQRRHILEPLLYDEAIKGALGDRFNKTYGAHAYNVLAPLIGQDLIRDLARLFLDEGPKAGSFVNLCRKMSDTKLHQAVREKFSSIPDKWNDKPLELSDVSADLLETIRVRRVEEGRREYAKHFDEVWAKVDSTRIAIENDESAKRIKMFRDKKLSA